jgi:antitoxin (DNA-binding transcriptional repressor) of toxin-antitoxin stability system
VTSSQLATSRAHIYTMRYLNQHTAEVIQDINRTEEPAAITLRGRFIALIAPLANASVESALLYSVLEENENVSQLTGESTSSDIFSSEDADARLSADRRATPPAKPVTFTMRYLNQKTAKAMQTVNDAKAPAVITRHGQFVALIFPLADVNVESALLGAIVEQTESLGHLLGSARGAHISSPEDADQKLASMESDD